MWGGKFSIDKTKIYGVWNPYIYPTDRYGKQIYAVRTVLNEAEKYDDNNAIISVVLDGESYHFIVPFNAFGNAGIEKVEGMEDYCPETAV